MLWIEVPFQTLLFHPCHGLQGFFNKDLREPSVRKPFREGYHCQGIHERYEACRLATKMLSLSEPPTAIFAASDTQAMGVLEAARNLGIRVPGDLSVIGYDDIEVAEYLGLTTIRQLLFESGQQGVQLLLNTLAEPPTDPHSIVLPTELIKRRTTASPHG